jgi:predicted NBD/HSP70 family sugar kinase
VSERAIQMQLAEAGRALPDLAAVARAAAGGDAIVCDILAAAGEHLGVALANLINVVNPGRIVLGGNLAALGPYLLPSAQRVLDTHALAALRDSATILVSELGADAVPLGGVAMAMADLLPLPRHASAAPSAEMMAGPY